MCLERLNVKKRFQDVHEPEVDRDTEEKKRRRYAR